MNIPYLIDALIAATVWIAYGYMVVFVTITLLSVAIDKPEYLHHYHKRVSIALFMVVVMLIWAPIVSRMLP